MQLQLVEARGPADLDRAFADMTRAGAGALMVLPIATFFSERKRIIEMAARNRLPAMYTSRRFVEDGGLMAYGADLTDLLRRAASYADRILKGARPSDLPVEQATKFELAINLGTAKALGLTIPQSVLLSADEVDRVSAASLLGTHSLGVFAATVFVVNATPGVDMMFVATRTLRHGVAGGIAAALGVVAGCVVHTLVAAFGLAALLAASGAAFALVKWAGAAYLLWLAIGMLREGASAAAERFRGRRRGRDARRGARRRSRRCFARGSSPTSSTPRSRSSSSRCCRSSSTPTRATSCSPSCSSAPGSSSRARSS